MSRLMAVIPSANFDSSSGRMCQQGQTAQSRLHTCIAYTGSSLAHLLHQFLQPSHTSNDASLEDIRHLTDINELLAVRPRMDNIH